MRSHQGRGRSGSPRRARHFLPGWEEPALEYRLLLSADVVPAATTTLTLSPTTLPNDTVGTNYPTSSSTAGTTVTASGGTGSYTYSVTSGALPAGLSLGDTTGTITGTPTTAGTSNFTITATDTDSDTGSEAYTVTINPALAITTTALPAATLNTAYNQTIATSGGTGADTFTESGTLPAGLTFTSAGVISGTPTAVGSSTFTVTATDTAGATATETYTLYVNQTVTIAPTSLPNDTVNTPYSQTITASGGSGGYTFSVSTGTLPTGLTLNSSSGAITGTPTATGTSDFTITATDSSKASGSQAYAITINPALAITTTTLPSATLNSPYSETIASTGGTGTSTFAVTTGTLPTGLNLSSAGVLSGTPTAAGSSTFTVTATDTAGATATETYTLYVNEFTLSPTTLPNDTINVPYNSSVAGSGGVSPYTYTVTTGNLPTGLTLNSSSGAITGTPTTAGTSDFTITATDSDSHTASQAYAVTINPAITITTTTLPNGLTSQSYSQTIKATGGTGALSYAVTSGSIGTLTLSSSTGLLAGSETTAGTLTFSITVSDTVGATATQSYAITFAAPISFTTTTLPNTTVGVPYDQTLTATGGTGTLTYAVTTGALPPGLTLSSAGVLSGTPTTPGTYGFTTTATDTSGNVGSQGFAITVNPALAFTTTSLPNGAVGAAYSQQVTATGGTAPLTYSLSAGSLPGGLSLSSSGLISGTPTIAGTTNFTVEATDAAGLTKTQPLSLTILPFGSATGPTVTSVVRNGVHRQNTTFTITFSTALNSTSAENVSNYTIVPIYHTRLDGPAVRLASAVYNASNNTVTLTAFGNVPLNQEYVLTINGTSPSGVQDTAGNFLAGLNGAAGTSYVQYFGPEILAGRTAQAAYESKLVTSLTTAIDESGLTNGDITSIITGTGAPGILAGSDVPLATRIKKLAHSPSPVVGAALSTVVRTILNPTTPVLALAPTTLPNDTVGIAYNETVTASNGVAPYTYEVTSSTGLPTGLSLDASTGAITGTPTTAGTYPFTISAIDADGVSGSQPYSVTINAALTFSTTTLPAAAVNSPYSHQIDVTGGTGAITYAVTTGSLPAGMALSSTGLLAGTPTTAATTTFTVTATDSVGATAAETYSFVVGAAIALTPTTLPNDTINNPYSETISATGGAGNFTYAVTTGTLPAGLTLGSTTGTISGTPTTAATSNFTVTATDTTGSHASQAYSVTINPAITFTTTSLPNGSVGTAYDQNVTATGGTGTLTYSLTAGNLPAGLSLASTGAIAGTPSASGTSNFTVTATDTVGASKNQNLSITIS